ncbi:hypothetical protein GGR26_000743 [Lewinella marina]|uniref:Uncharacterized protein n=1 Tax=Neolewinella marina TaxID=438751 RepID=A0A2G0CIP7_9BACT|nr:EboA domain-containing protein [Neolewinella marina]NJB84998.1 hypothetical protein [Neolewinella marina]PHK99852.1 hypothetical protein CGL56_02065 [Neolewinella marina]
MNGTIHHILLRHLSPEGRRWLEGKLAALETDFKPRSFYLAFGACPRFLGKDELQFTEAEYSSFNAIYPNFGATSWTNDELGRILLMCALPPSDNHAVLEELFNTADYRELMALYRGLYFLSNAGDFTDRAREGLRTNMVGVFDALALDNPYPARYLSEDAWNQMVLKAKFMQRPMYRIYRIEERKNQKLADIFLDYAEERWSAHRPVSPELWRFVAGFVSERSLPGLQKTFREGDELERVAATKALHDSNHAPAREWLAEQGVSTDNLPPWNEIGRRHERAGV